MKLSSGHNPSSAVTLGLSRVPHRYKYCKPLSAVCPCASLCTHLSSFAHLPHLPPLSFWPSATCGFLLLSTIHLGTPQCGMAVLNAFLKSRPDSSVRSKLSFLLDHSDPLSSNLLPSIKAKHSVLEPAAWNNPLLLCTETCSAGTYLPPSLVSPRFCNIPPGRHIP